MKYLTCLLLTFCSLQDTVAQNGIYKDSVELLLKSTKHGNRIYREKDIEGKHLYFYNKSRKQVTTIVLNAVNEHSAYEYHFINRQLVKMKLYLPYSINPKSVGKPMSAVYYFSNDTLVQKIGINFPLVDIDTYKVLGLKSFNRAEQFIKSR